MSYKEQADAIRTEIFHNEREKAKYHAVISALKIEYNDLASEYANIPPEYVWIPDMWDCEDEKNAFGKCIYNLAEDSCADSCVFCGDPYERK